MIDQANIDGLKDWLDARWSECARCGLADYRTNIVLGDFGPVPLVFLGEAPGSDEDEQGRPFIGRAGQTLRKMAKHVRTPLSNSTVINTLACRPPGNRNPKPKELSACERRVFGVLRALQPKLVVALGRIPAEFLLKRKVAITRERGKVFRSEWTPGWQGGILLTLHPAYVLRNPRAASELEEDLRAAGRLIA